MLVSNQKQVLDQVKNMMLEQQVNNLENSLSNTISFFSIVLAIAAVLIGLIGWWMNKTFSNKLDEVRKVSADVERKSENINELEKKVLDKSEYIDRLYDSIKEWEHYKKETNENIEGMKLWSEMLEEALSIQIEVNEFKRIEDRVDELEKSITQNQIDGFPWEDTQMSTNENFKYHKSYYTEAQDAIKKVKLRKALDLKEFVSDLDPGYEKVSSELFDFLADAKEYMELLIKIKNH